MPNNRRTRKKEHTQNRLENSQKYIDVANEDRVKSSSVKSSQVSASQGMVKSERNGDRERQPTSGIKKKQEGSRIPSETREYRPRTIYRRRRKRKGNKGERMRKNEEVMGAFFLTCVCVCERRITKADTQRI